ncbi:MAG: glycosyltransferase, partial [Bacteroidota bacterium]
MNILHVLSQFEVTGAEVYAVTLANAQLHRGHQPVIVSDTLSTPAEVPYIQLPVGRRSYSQRLKNISELSRLIDRNSIDVVHAHSRAASWVSYFATRRTGTAFVSTIHGRQHLHFSSKSFSVYGRHIIAVSESLKEHLVRELGLQSSDIVVVPNGLDIERWTHHRGSASKRRVFGVEQNVKVILFVGRLSGPKGDIVRFIVSEVVPRLEHKMNFVFCVVGGLHVPDDIPELFEETNRVFGRQVVILKDFQSDILPYLWAADLVVASGRVVMESLLAGRPTMAFGETNYHGFVTESTFEEAMKTNFGDTGVLEKPDAGTVAADLQASVKKKKGLSLSIRNQLRERFDVRTVEPRIYQVYEKARAKILVPPHIPVLMYHRVVEKPPTGSKHGIWVTANQFRDQLVSLRVRGYTPITFGQYRNFVIGNSMLP